MMKRLAVLLTAALLVCLWGCAAKAPADGVPSGTAAPAPGTSASEPGTNASEPETGAAGEETVTYTVFAYGSEPSEGVKGVVFNFCTDTACWPVITSEEGKAVFTGPPARYHVQAAKCPEGWRLAQEADGEFYTEPYAQTFRIAFTASGE